MAYLRQFRLFSHNDALAHTRVFNIKDIQEYMWLQIPAVLSPYIDLTGVVNMQVADGALPDFTEKITREGRNCWLKIDSTLFDTSIGLHFYRFDFHNPTTDEVIPLYFAYSLQNDDPEKPYIYMDRSES